MFNIERYEGRLLAFITQQMSIDVAHDLNHVRRVVKLAKELAVAEGADLAVVVPSAYLHDCFSYPKDHPERRDSSRLAAIKACSFLQDIQYPAQYLAQVSHAIEAHSFSARIKASSIAAQVVQDADRLDALGAVGISRCIQVGSALSRGFYADEDPFCQQRTPDDQQYSVDHFYQKLLTLAATIHTESAKVEAAKRIAFMHDFLAQLAKEI